VVDIPLAFYLNSVVSLWGKPVAIDITYRREVTTLALLKQTMDDLKDRALVILLEYDDSKLEILVRTDR
jgi:hypothetical protein